MGLWIRRTEGSSEVQWAGKILDFSLACGGDAEG